MSHGVHRPDHVGPEAHGDYQLVPVVHQGCIGAEVGHIAGTVVASQLPHCMYLWVHVRSQGVDQPLLLHRLHYVGDEQVHDSIVALGGDQSANVQVLFVINHRRLLQTFSSGARAGLITGTEVRSATAPTIQAGHLPPVLHGCC